MRTPAELRAEARRCLQSAADAADVESRKRLVARAFELAQQAEVLERSANAPPKHAVDKCKPD